MDIQKVNTVLSRALRILESDEAETLQGLTESYVGYGGTEAPDHTPMGDAMTGGDGGVDNMESAEEQFYSYLITVAETCAQDCGMSSDDAVKYMEALAKDMAAAGEIPPMPNAESGTAEEFSTWPGAAKTAGFEKRLSEYSKMMKGQDPSVGTSSNSA
jgi:hypothetical protein